MSNIPQFVRLFALVSFFFSFFFNDTATTEIYTLSLHDALPISSRCRGRSGRPGRSPGAGSRARTRDRKSTRLNSSHMSISYAVFCLKKKTIEVQRNAGIKHPEFCQRAVKDPRIAARIRHNADTVIEHGVVAVGFFLQDTATTEIYTLSLHDALPI